ncbi:MAG: hypothetical protein Q8Q95_00695 [bacterium]|nr:hypothetical protein [bacterium]
MGIFSNFKINSLRKKIEGNYESRLEKIALDLKNLPQDQRLGLAAKLGFLLQASAFAKIMNHALFHPDSGIFMNDVNNLNENRFNLLYQAMVIWFSWIQISLDSEDKKNQKGINFSIDSLETGLGINRLVIKVYYDGLASNISLINFALYRWCMLAVDHTDNYYETMHENSPDCKKFIEIANLAKEEAEKALD